MVVDVKMRPFDADHKQEYELEEAISNSVYHRSTISAFAFSSFCHSLCSFGIVAMLEVWYWCLQSFYVALVQVPLCTSSSSVQDAALTRLQQDLYLWSWDVSGGER